MSAGMVVLGFIIGILILLILVTIHEFAHFIVAKLAGAYVYEFAIGFGPKIFSWGKRETRYSIRIFPFGGYVYIASELTDAPKGREEEVVVKERKMENIAKWKRLLFIVSGAFINFFIAVFIFTTTFAALNYKPSDMTYWGAIYDKTGSAYDAFQRAQPGVVIGQDIVILDYWVGANRDQLIVAADFYKNSNYLNDHPDNTPNKIQASHLGLKTNIPTYQTTVYDFIAKLQKQYRENPGPDHKDQIIFNYVHVNSAKEITKDRALTLPVLLKETNGTYSVGIRAPNRYFTSSTHAYGYGWRESFTQSVTILKSFGLLFTGQWAQLSGPVGIAKTVSSILTEGPALFFLYVALISANLFVLNLIPIPPLDGYKFLETSIEGSVWGIRRLRYRFLIWKNRKEPTNQDLIISEYQSKDQNWQLPHKAKIIINITGAIVFLLLFVGITIKDVFF